MTVCIFIVIGANHNGLAQADKRYTAQTGTSKAGAALAPMLIDHTPRIPLHGRGGIPLNVPEQLSDSTQSSYVPYNQGGGSFHYKQAPILFPKLETGFEAIHDTGWAPADPVGACGIDHVGVLVNMSCAFFTKDGTEGLSSTLYDWFDPVMPSYYFGPFDPKIIYDHHSDRWVMLGLAYDSYLSKAWYCVSASQTSDPAGDWWLYALDASEGRTNWPDYPGLGFDDRAIYITSNQWTFGGVQFDYAMIRVIRKTELYSGSPLLYLDFTGMTDPDGETSYTIKPAHTFGTPGKQYLVNTKWDEGDHVVLWHIEDPASGLPVLVQDGEVPVRGYELPPDAEQLGSSSLIETNSCITQDCQYREGYLYTVFTEGWTWTSGLYSAIRLLKIDVDNLEPKIDFTFGKDDHYYYYPAVYTAPGGRIAMVYNRSSRSEHVGMWYTGNCAILPREGSIKEGESDYSYSGLCRWGDYNGIAADPADPYKIWMFSMYPVAPTLWRTYVGGVRIPTFSD